MRSCGCAGEWCEWDGGPVCFRCGHHLDLAVDDPVATYPESDWYCDPCWAEMGRQLARRIDAGWSGTPDVEDRWWQRPAPSEFALPKVRW